MASKGGFVIKQKRLAMAVTGRRPKQLLGGYNLKDGPNAILRVLFEHLIDEALADYEQVVCISGMALGVDTIFALATLKAKELHGERVKLVCAVPFTDQASKWPEKSQRLYSAILQRSDGVVNTSGDKTYKARYMHQRNEWMVDNCDILLAVWEGLEEGGTYECIKYAKRKGKPVYPIEAGLKRG